MFFRGLPTVFFLTGCILLLGVVTTACGGGTGQSDGEQQEVKIAHGVIETTDAESRRLTLQPVQKNERLSFRVAPKASITVDGRYAEMASIEEGQHARVRYIVRDERHRTQAVAVFSFGGGSG